MKENRIHTPEGVRDIYGEECRTKTALESRLMHILSLYDYQEIRTPVFEYFDVFNRDKGTAQSREMYKFFDRENNTLVLRPDMTPGIARAVSKMPLDDGQYVRLCYTGETFKNYSRLQGKLCETTNVGAELIGDDTSAADGEMISMAVDCLKSSGLSEFLLSVGNVQYFKGLVSEAGFDDEQTAKVRSAINNKNTFAIEKICRDEDLRDDLTDAFVSLGSQAGSIDVIRDAKKKTRNEICIKAIERMEKLDEIIRLYGYENYISYDLSMLSDYEYYTGIIFRGYTYGAGSAVVTGGRYNGLLLQFGVDRPSTGFAVMVDELMMALSDQHISTASEHPSVTVLYDKDRLREAIDLARFFRNSDIICELDRKSSKTDTADYVTHSFDQGGNGVYYLKGSDQGVLYYSGRDSEPVETAIKDIKEKLKQ